MFVELHIIQSFPPSNLNRDDLGQPKDADFGGHRRARISSQCIKRSTRYAGGNKMTNTLPIFVRQTGVPLGSRTQLVVRSLMRLLKEKFERPEQDAEKVAKEFAKVFAEGIKEENNTIKTSVLIYFGNDELSWVAAKLNEKWDELMIALSPITPMDEIAQQLATTISQRVQQLTKGDGVAISKISNEVESRLIAKSIEAKQAKILSTAFKKSFEAVKGDTRLIAISEMDWLVGAIIAQITAIETSMSASSPLEPIVIEMLKQTEGHTGAPDIALFGRMLASKPNTNIDAACQVAHAISTHAIAGKTPTDYYTAMDDEKTNKEPGAGFLDTAYFNSACFYRYSRLDYALLKANLREKDLQGNDLHDLPRRTVEAFLRASQAAIPTGKKNRFAPEVRPSFMLAVLRDKESEGWSLVNAFQKPVGSSPEEVQDGLVLASVKKLEKCFEHLINFYGDETVKAIAVALPDGEIEGTDLGKRFQAAEKGMNGWIEAICGPLNNEG